MIRITHIISGLERGGAESTLKKLLQNLDRDAFQCDVISLSSIGVVGAELQQLGFDVVALEMNPNHLQLGKLISLVRHLRQRRPDVVQTWMYHADLLGGIAAKLARVPALAWNIRHSDLNHFSDKRRTRLIAQSCALLSRFVPDKIVCCAESARQNHIAMGYSAKPMLVIDNGFDTELFAPDQQARLALRTSLQVPSNVPLIGLVARVHPQKGHDVFLKAAAQIVTDDIAAHFLLCGQGASAANVQLQHQLTQLNLVNRVHLLGERDDMPSIQAALDVACSASVVSEGFSNTIGEAMSCAVPCVVTNVGESARIVGATGWIVEPGDSQALSAALVAAISLEEHDYSRRSSAARARIIEHYGLSKAVAAYARTYRDMASP
ncbi:MAG: glycosyltransferase [Pseudomonadales bacterium]